MFSAQASTTWSSFIVNNNLISSSDTILLSHSGGGGGNNYLFTVGRIINAVSFVINFTSLSGVFSDTPVINFTIIKSVSA